MAKKPRKRISVNDPAQTKRLTAKSEVKKIDRLVEKLRAGTGATEKRLERIEKAMAYLIEMLT